MRFFSKFALVLFASTFLVWESDSTKTISAQSKNIIFILADDLGWTDVSIESTTLGNQTDFYRTPTLEQLASEGMSFNNAYTCGANCAPTRAAIFTGQYAIRSTNNVFNVTNLNRGNNANNSTLIGPPQGLPNGEDQIPASAFTVAEMLKTANYDTAHFGKFHVGTSSGSNAVTSQGFDQNFGGGGSGAPNNYFSNGSNFAGGIGAGLDAYAADYTSEQSQALTGTEVLTGTRKHVTDAITEAVFDFVADSQSTPGSPFFLHIGHFAVHTPISGQGRPDLVAEYEALPPGQFHTNTDYAALIEGVDQSTHQILQMLQATPDVNNPGMMLSETTMIIFYSDNGGREGPTENEPLRARKGEYREGGIRVPMIVWAPGTVPANTINSTPVNSTDFFMTFADIANVDVDNVLPANYEMLDGESLLPIFESETASLQRESIFWHFPGYLIDGSRNQRPQSIIRKDQYKLTFNYEARNYELYDLDTDIGETTNLISNPKFESVAIQMSTELRQFLVDNQAVLPTERATGNTVDYPEVFVGFMPSVWDGGNGFFTDNNWNGGQPHPGTINAGSVELEGEAVEISSGMVDSDSLRIRTAGGSFIVENAGLTADSTGDLSALDIGSTATGSGATTAVIANADVTLIGSGSSSRTMFVRNESMLTLDNTILDVQHSSSDASRATLEIESGGLVVILNNTNVNAEVLRIDNSGLGLSLQSGEITLNNAHAIRGATSFNGQLSFDGPGGQSEIVHTDLTNSNLVRHLAGRVTNNFFAIDGVTISPDTTYNGSNIAAINAELELLEVNGRFLQLEEENGVQTLRLLSNVLIGDVNLDGVVNLLDVAPFVDLLTAGQFQVEADINGDGDVNLLDVMPFVNLLAG